ncbi:hypothetical protein [Streptomyces sp. GESEQ-4]|uniref:hypothetical protein n=1 Tax=Streptomyces sp. GESEQ-4 TaxID=2812655 RepID=UPI001B32ADBA|nr:hypothetical protein [Streptomyces sp. GESEQ-4]
MLARTITHTVCNDGKEGEPDEGYRFAELARIAGQSVLDEGPDKQELSCGTYGFRDLRYLCPTPGEPWRCSTTTQVLVRNTGPAPVYVTAIHGARQGVRQQGPEQEINPRHTVAVRPGPGHLLFDLTLRGAGPVKSLTVASVR